MSGIVASGWITDEKLRRASEACEQAVNHLIGGTSEDVFLLAALLVLGIERMLAAEPDWGPPEIAVELLSLTNCLRRAGYAPTINARPTQEAADGQTRAE